MDSRFVSAHGRAPASAPASRTSFGRAKRITVSTLRNSTLAEEDEEDGQFATVRDDESMIPTIMLEGPSPPSSYRGSPATARAANFNWESQIIDQQLRRAPLMASRGELARLATARRMHNRRAQSMYIPSETPATPPLSPPNAGFSSLTSPAPFTSATTPFPFVVNHLGGMHQGMPMMPMMPMTAAAYQVSGRQQAAPVRQQHRRSTSGGETKAQLKAAQLPSLDDIRVLFEKRKAAKAEAEAEAPKADEQANKTAKDEEQKEEQSRSPSPKSDEDEDKKKDSPRARTASGLKVLKRRSLALQQIDADAVAELASPKPVDAPAATEEQSPTSAGRPQLHALRTAMPAIKVEEPDSATVSPVSAKKRRPLSLQVPPREAFQGLPGVLRSPEPPRGLLAMRQREGAGSAEGRAMAARKMINRLSLSQRVVTVA